MLVEKRLCSDKVDKEERVEQKLSYLAKIAC
jgi:hypothetical protein